MRQPSTATLRQLRARLNPRAASAIPLSPGMTWNSPRQRYRQGSGMPWRRSSGTGTPARRMASSTTSRLRSSWRG